MGTKRPICNITGNFSSLTTKDKLLSSGTDTRDQSPLSGMRGIFHRGDSNPNQIREKESETEKSRDRMRDEEIIDLERPSNRDKVWRQADGRDKHCRLLSTAERTQTERDVKKGRKKGDTFPRERKEDRDAEMRKMGKERGEMRHRDGPRREQMEDREIERLKRQEREREETQARAIEGRRPPEDIRTEKRERYKKSGVEFQDRRVEGDDIWYRRERNAGRQRDQFSTVMDMKESERYSPQRRPVTEMYIENRDSIPRRDVRSEGDVERQRERREKIRDQDREEKREKMPFNRNEKFYQSRRARGKNRVGYHERYREEMNKEREKEDRERHRDGGMEVRPVDRETERCRGIESDDPYRNDRRDRERRKRQADENADNRSLSNYSRVPPRGHSSGERISEGNSEMRYIRNFDREEKRKDGSVVKQPPIDLVQAGESQRQLAKSKRSDGDETSSLVLDKTQMWLEPQRGRAGAREREEGRRENERAIKSHSEEVLQFQRDPYRRNMTQSGERHLERREYSGDSEGMSVDGDEEEEICKETIIEEKESLSNRGGGTERSQRRYIPGENLISYTSGSDEERSDSGSIEGSDDSWNPERDRKLSSECSNVNLSSGGDDGDERDQFSDPGYSNKKEEESTAGEEEVTHAEQQGRDKKVIFCVVGQNSSRSETSEVSLSQDEEMGGVKIHDPYIEGHHRSSDEDTREPQHDPREEQPLVSHYTGNGYSTPRGGSFISGDPSGGDFYIAPVDLQDKEVEEIMKKEPLPTEIHVKKRDSKTERLLVHWREKNNRKGDPTFYAPTNSFGEIHHHGSLEIKTQEMSPEEMEALQIQMSRTEINPEPNKRISQPPHLKWATSVVREILGNSGEQMEEDANSKAEENQHIKQTENNEHQAEAEHKSGKLPTLTLTTDDHQSEPEVEEEEEEDDLDYREGESQEVMEEKGQRVEEILGDKIMGITEVTLRTSCSFYESGPEIRLRRMGIRKTKERRNRDYAEVEREEEGVGRDRRTRILCSTEDNDIRSKSWGEVDLKNVLNSMGRHTRKSSFYNRPQLYQQYNEETQNIEILRQSRSDNLSINEGNSRSPLPSPTAARRPLPPLPSVLHPHSLSLSASINCSQTLSIPERAQSERRASSPSLSVSLTQQSSLLWRDLPAVRSSPGMGMLTEDQRRLQEVRFEVVTSEASYCRSLDIVVEHFVKCKELEKLLTTQEKNWLFSRLTEVRAISHRFLSKLEERVESDVLHFTVCDIIARQCQRFRKVYVPYLTNQSYQDATYQRLMNDNPNFKRVVDSLERSSVCQRLPLRSFLVLPFQRITRIKLLVQNILKRTFPGTVEAENTIKALRRLERIIQDSNDSIAEMKTIESLVSLSGKVEFVECKTLPLISQKRRLVREGPITELMDFSLKQSERTIYLHLFNDYLLVSLQKEGGRFTVIDHCPVDELRTEDFRVKILTIQKNSFRLHMSQRSLLLRTDTQSGKLRWLSALSRSHPVVDFSAAEKSVQMQCIRAYVAQQPDELSVEKADVILVHQDTTDNWVEGTRLSDLHCGWVPNSHLKVISNDKVKQRNLSDALALTKAKAAV